MRTTFAIVFLILSISVLSKAQTRKMSGTVKDNEGQPVIGAGAICKEAPASGTVTDLNGRFNLEVPAGVKTVVFSSVGMSDFEYKIGEGSLEGLQIIMNYAENLLDQVVVTGYAQTTVKRITGSVGIMSSEQFKSKPLASVSALMQGEVAGVSVNAISGQPGTQAKIRIRGANNISGTGEPLWVIDGVPLQNESPALTKDQLATGGFDNIFVNGVGGINPNDIESITILKDAAAAAIYGSRAANGVIVVTTKQGQAGRMKVSYNNNFTWSFRPQKNLDLMNSSEKLSWEQELWDEFSAEGYKRSLTDNTAFFPIIGIVGQIRSGSGRFASIKDNKAEQDAYIKSLENVDTNWYDLIFRNAFSHNHHLSLSGGSEKYTYYVSGGFNNDSGMLIKNSYKRYNFNANIRLKPTDRISLNLGAETSMQRSKKPESSVDPFLYAYYANPYEKAYNEDGTYSGDDTYFSLGFYNGRKDEMVLPANGFNILRELNSNSTSTANNSNTLRGQLDLSLSESLKFIGLASYSYSNNSSDKIVEKHTFSAFNDRLGNDNKSLTKLYGNISQNRTNRSSYVLRGHLAYNRTFIERHTINLIAGAEIRGSSSKTIFTKRYNYDPKTGTSSLPEISGPADQWLSQVERLNGQYFTESRYASFYASADYYLGKTIVANTSFRTDGSSNFGSNKQFNPTWSAGAAWHIGEEDFMKKIPFVSHATLRLAYGFTGEVNTRTSHLLVMEYLRQQYRYYEGGSYMLGHIPSAPNPDLSWEKTGDTKAGLDFGLWKDRLTINTEGYYRLSSDVVSFSPVQSTTGYNNVYFNSAEIMNTGIETTVKGEILRGKIWRMSASVNFAYNYNKVSKYQPVGNLGITSKDRYVAGYPISSIFAGKYYGIDRTSGLYAFRLRDDAKIGSISDLNEPGNYRYFLGTTIAPFTGGFNLTVSYKELKLSLTGVYSFGSKTYDKLRYPASYLNAKHSGVTVEEIQSEHSDLYTNHLNVNRDRADRWTEERTTGVKYPRIYDRFNGKYNFAANNPMDFSIIDAIYLKNNSYIRFKTMLLTYSIPEAIVKKMRLRSLSLNLSFNNFFTITSYDGMDPEIPGATYPTTRSVSGGISIDF